MRKKYQDIVRNQPTLNVKENAREVVINIVKVMDNPAKMVFKKDSQGDFKLNTCGDAYSNFQLKVDRDDLEWSADDQNWSEVFKLINQGVCVVESVKSR